MSYIHLVGNQLLRDNPNGRKRYKKKNNGLDHKIIRRDDVNWTLQEGLVML